MDLGVDWADVSAADGFVCDISQNVKRAANKSHHVSTPLQNSFKYSYAHDRLLVAGDWASLLGWPVDAFDHWDEPTARKMIGESIACQQMGTVAMAVCKHLRAPGLFIEFASPSVPA
eukprot:5826411-Pyramimonas_sp.AAC.1